MRCKSHLTSRFCGVELGLKLTSNMVSESLFKKPILTRFLGHFVPPAIGPLTDHPLISSPVKCTYLNVRGCVGSLTSTTDTHRLQIRQFHSI